MPSHMVVNKPGTFFCLMFLFVTFSTIILHHSTTPGEIYLSNPRAPGINDEIPSEKGNQHRPLIPIHHNLPPPEPIIRHRDSPLNIPGAENHQFDKVLYREKRGQASHHLKDKNLLSHHKKHDNSTLTDSSDGQINQYTKPDRVHHNLNGKSLSCDEKVIIFVVSSITNIYLRTAIRETWGSVSYQKTHRFCLRFIVGSPSTKDTESNITLHVTRELSTHNDVIVTDAVESYSNLTFKTVAMLGWCDTQHCPRVETVLKTDDDVFLNIPNIMHFTSSFYGHRKNTRTLTGHVITSGEPIRQRYSKYYMPTSMYRKSSYPPYLSGSAYILPIEAVAVLRSRINQQKQFWLEDIYITGILAKSCGLRLMHRDGFIISKKGVVTSIRKSICRQQFFTLHELTDTEMYEMWHVSSQCIR